jgi:hypothetical protein
VGGATHLVFEPIAVGELLVVGSVASWWCSTCSLPVFSSSFFLSNLSGVLVQVSVVLFFVVLGSVFLVHFLIFYYVDVSLICTAIFRYIYIFIFAIKKSQMNYMMKWYSRFG